MRLPQKGAVMSYVDRNLLQGEEVVYRAKLHLVVFALPAGIAVFGLVLAAVVASWTAAIVFVVLAIVVAFPRYIRFVSSEFAVTNKRVIVKLGLVYRRTLELVLSKVETIGVEQSIMGRVFNYGTIVVTGTGGTKEPFKDIANPLEFRRRVQSQLA
jgi:uncharacterized membrane protein YdbT with pleckstrin-like domain